MFSGNGLLSLAVDLSPAPLFVQSSILGLPWWVWLIVLTLIIIVVLLVALQEKPQEQTQEVVEKRIQSDTHPVEDLTRIEGIGPKINATLQQKGITSFQKLAETSVDDLQKILDEVNIRLAKPTTWPDQSALAAAGKWEDLQKLQDELKGGRQVG